MLGHKSLTRTIKKKPHVSKNLCIIGNTILSKSDFTVYVSSSSQRCHLQHAGFHGIKHTV